MLADPTSATSAQMPADPKERFADRVSDYVRGRPGYPPAIVTALMEGSVLPAGAVVADVGAGTGASSEIFLDVGYRVIAIEPNAAMRAAADARLGHRAGYRSVHGAAEATSLDARSVDLVVAAQAFHWFDLDAARTEFRRILRPPGAAALIWNARRAGGTPFLEGYEALLLRFGTDYQEVGHRGVSHERLARFFGGPFETRRFENAQELDLDGLTSRLLSSSYTPGPDHPDRAPMLATLERLFTQNAVDGRVRIEYDVDLFFAPLRAA